MKSVTLNLNRSNNVRRNVAKVTNGSAITINGNITKTKKEYNHSNDYNTKGINTTTNISKNSSLNVMSGISTKKQQV